MILESIVSFKFTSVTHKMIKLQMIHLMKNFAIFETIWVTQQENRVPQLNNLHRWRELFEELAQLHICWLEITA